MSYHPSIGHLRAQLPRIAVIAALLAASGTLLGLHQQQTQLPSDRWYRLSRQRVMEADLTWRIAEALDRSGRRMEIATGEAARRMREQAVALWERRALADTANHAAAYRLGVIYGNRGYTEQSADMLTLAASIDEHSSDYYHAISEIYSNPELSDRELREKARKVETRASWIADIALADALRRLDDEQQLARVQSRQEARSLSFAIQFLALAGAFGMLLGLGVVTIAVMVLRYGFTVRRKAARLPFNVPWTLIDTAEAIAVLLFTLVAGGMLTGITIGRLLPAEAPLTQPLMMAAQYLLVAVITIGVIFYRMRGLSSSPLRTLGMRLQGSSRLIATGIAGYAVFVTGIVAFAALLGTLLGDAMPLAQAIEEVIGAAQTPGEIAIYFVLVCILAPIVEELVFRGYVYGGLRRLMTVRQAIVVGAALFAAVHLSAEAFLMIGLIGALLCYLYERTRSLLPGMIAHGVHNGLVLAVMLLQSA